MTREAAETVAGQMGCPYLETSAKTGGNVKEAFDALVLQVRKGEAASRQIDEADSKPSCCTIS